MRRKPRIAIWWLRGRNQSTGCARELEGGERTLSEQTVWNLAQDSSGLQETQSRLSRRTDQPLTDSLEYVQGAAAENNEENETSSEKQNQNPNPKRAIRAE